MKLKLWGGKIVSNGVGMSIIPNVSTGEGDYYLAPSVKFAKIGLGNHVEEFVYVDENGDNHYGIEDLFESQIQTMEFDLYYDSSNARDNYTNMGHWRNSFVSELDFDINEDDLKDKSNFYETQRDACEVGFDDIKESVYRGILSNATSVYDKNGDSCIIKEDGQDIGEFLVWNRSEPREDVHYLTTDRGEFIVFVKGEDGKFTTEQNGIIIELEEDENGTLSYKDSQDVLRSYNSEGKLSYIMDKGQETHIEYNENGDISKVKGAMDNIINFQYNEKNLISQIDTKDGKLEILFDYNDQNFLSNYTFNSTEFNSTNVEKFNLTLGYDEKNLLSVVDFGEKSTPDGEIIPSSILYYGYDLLNRVATIESSGRVQNISYTNDSVIKELPSGMIATAQIDFIHSKQAILEISDDKSTTKLKYDKRGFLSDMELITEVEVDMNSSSNIESNSLKSTIDSLRIQIDHNDKGLIKSQYLESSSGMKSLKTFEYKTKYNKPTKVLSEDSAIFFDFNNKGQLIKKSYLKYDKDMKIKPHTIADIKSEDGYQEVSYKYDGQGFLSRKINEVTSEEKNFYVTKDGKVEKGNIKEAAIVSWYQNWTAGLVVMVIGHSYGGDSAVEASKQTSWSKKVDLLITVDPVGTGDWTDGARCWVQINAMPGRWYGYLKVKWVRKWWGGYPKFKWIESQWNGSDWIAWAGGKGSYSTYDKGEGHTNLFYRTPAHHEDFGYLLQVLQSLGPNFNYNIKDNTSYSISSEYK